MASVTSQVSVSRSLATILGVAIGGFVGFGCFFFPALVIFMRPMLVEFGWGRTELSFAFSAAMLGCALGAPIGGRLIDRFGVRPVTLASAIMLSGLMLVMSLLQGSVTILIILTFAIGLLGAPTTSLGYVSILPQWFNRRLGTAIAFATVGYGLGNSLWPLISQAIISGGDWRTGLRIISTFPIIGGAVAFYLLKERRVLDPIGEPAIGSAVSLTVKEAARGRHLWVMLLVFFLVSACSLSFMPQVPLLITDRGFSLAQGAQGSFLLGIGFLVSRLLCGILVDYILAPIVSSLFFLMSALGFWIMQDATSFGALGVSCVLLGFAIGTEQDMMAYLVRRYLGMRAYGTFFGFNMSAFSLGGVVAPPLFGMYFDKYRDYQVPLNLMMICMLVSAALILTLGAYPQFHGSRKPASEIIPKRATA